MSDLVKQMKTTLSLDVICNGNKFERSIAERQLNEAIKKIEELESTTNILQELCALLDRIELKNDASLASQRFEIFEKYGTVIWGQEVSGVEQ